AFDSAIVIKPVVVGGRTVARIQPFLRLTFGSAVADLAQVRSRRDRLAQSRADDRGGLGRAQQVGAEDFDRPARYESGQPFGSRFRIALAARGEGGIVPSADRVFGMMDGLRMRNNEDLLHGFALSAARTSFQ